MLQKKISIYVVLMTITMPVSAHAPGSTHARPYAQPPINMDGNYLIPLQYASWNFPPFIYVHCLREVITFHMYCTQIVSKVYLYLWVQTIPTVMHFSYRLKFCVNQSENGLDTCLGYN